MRHLQHLKNTDATCEQRFADINEKRLHPEDDRLQHVNNIVTTPQQKRSQKKQEAGPSHPRVPWPWVERQLAASELRGPRRRPGMRLRRPGGGGSTPPASSHSSTGAREQLLQLPHGAAACGMRDCASAGRPRRLAWRR
jgi:hypothetical protein